MTKAETVTILMMLNSFYSGGKNDPQLQAEAWHMILSKYDFQSAQKAVLNYAENDVRDYATFPAVGVIVKEIRDQQMREARPIREVIRGISYGKGYGELSDTAQSIISEEKYNDWLGINAEEFASKVDYFADQLSTGRMLMLE